MRCSGNIGAMDSDDENRQLNKDTEFWPKFFFLSVYLTRLILEIRNIANLL